MAPKGTKHPAQLKPAAACRPARTLRGPPTRAAPPQRHGRRRMAAARPAATARERRRAPDDTLRRQLPREPYPSTLPPCAHVPSDRHAQPSAEPADGSRLAPPPPPARGAAASSSPPSAVISPLICAPQQLYAVRSDLYIGVVLEITTPARGQEMGTRTGNFPVLPPLRGQSMHERTGNRNSPKTASFSVFLVT